MPNLCLTLDAEGDHTGFSRASLPVDLLLHLGDRIDVIEPRSGLQTTADVTGFTGDNDEYVLVRVDWDGIEYEGMSGA